MTLRLKYDFRRAGHNPPSRELYLKVVEIYLDGLAADRLAYTPRIRQIMKNREIATAQQLLGVDEWLLEEFSDNLEEETELNLQSEIENFSQKQNDETNHRKPETLVSYYQRASNLLHRSHGRDRPRQESPVSPLTGLEEFMLNTIIIAYVKGLSDSRLRQKVLERDGATCGSLWRVYEIVQSSQRSIELLDQVEKELGDRSRLTKLEEFVSSQYGRSAVSILADVDAGKIASSFKPSFPQNYTSLNISKNSNTASSSGPFQASTDVNNNRYVNWGDQKSSQPCSSGNPPQSARDQRTMPSASDSLYHIINGSRKNNPNQDGPLRVNRGNFRHRWNQCKGASLPYWEQSYLKSIVFGGVSVQSAQCYFNQMVREDQSTYSDEEGYTEPHIQKQRNSFYPSSYSIDLVDSNPQPPPEDIYPIKESSFEETPSNPAYAKRSKRYKEEPIIDLMSFIAELKENSRKRMRIDEIIEDNHEFSSRPKRTSRALKGEAKIRKLREIIGRRDLGPIDYRKLAAEIKVPINLLDLFQISPDFAKNFKKLCTRTNQKRKEKEWETNARVETVSIDAFDTNSNTNGGKVDTNIEILPCPNHFPVVGADIKALRVPTIVRTKSSDTKRRITLPLGVSQADQASDINVCSPVLSSALSTKIYKLCSHGFDSGLQMMTADSNSSRLTKFWKLEICTQGIWRKFWFFVRPELRNDNGFHLLLGLSWLDDVDARIHMRKSCIEIGDCATGENTTIIRGPVFVHSKRHGLVPFPKNPKPTHINKKPIVLRTELDHGKSYQLRQIDGTPIRFTYHSDHLKAFRLREAYLRSSEEESLPVYQNIRLRKSKHGLPKTVRRRPGVIGHSYEFMGILWESADFKPD